MPSSGGATEAEQMPGRKTSFTTSTGTRARWLKLIRIAEMAAVEINEVIAAKREADYQGRRIIDERKGKQSSLGKSPQDILYEAVGLLIQTNSIHHVKKNWICSGNIAPVGS